MKKRIMAVVISALLLMSATAQANEVEYLDVTKRSIGEAADAAGMSYEEYKNYMLLNDDIPAWETEHAATLKTYVLPRLTRYGMTVDEFKTECKLTIDITDTTTWYEVYNNMPLSVYWDADYEIAVGYYELGDEVNEDTLYGDVRAKVETIDMNTIERDSFSDVGYAHWAHYFISEMQEMSIIDGYDDGTYLPEKSVTRAEFAKIMAICTDMDTENIENKFSDVSDDAWYAPYVNAVSEYIDTENGEFKPEAPATREVVATALVKWLGVSKGTTAEDLEAIFTDVDSVSEKNAIYVADAVKKGIIDGFDDNTVRGGDSLTRAQAATVIYRAFYEHAEVPDALLEVVAEVGDMKITLGDAIYTVGIDTYADLNNLEVFREQIRTAVEMTTDYFKYTEFAKNEGIILTEDDILSALYARAQYSSGIGYRKYCNYLKTQGSSIEYVTNYTHMIAYTQKLSDIYTEEDLVKSIEKIEVKFNEDLLNNITVDDIAVG